MFLNVVIKLNVTKERHHKGIIIFWELMIRINSFTNIIFIEADKKFLTVFSLITLLIL